MTNGSKLEQLFKRTASQPSGDCPLPEPERGAPIIEDPHMLDIKKQPADFNYDIKTTQEENEGFIAAVEKLARIDPEVAEWWKENKTKV